MEAHPTNLSSKSVNAPVSSEIKGHSADKVTHLTKRAIWDLRDSSKDSVFKDK